MWFEKLGYCVLLAVVAYCCGNFNGSIIISRFRHKSDVREQGSGNAGLTNFYRCYGKTGLFTVVIIDFFKAVVATLTGSIVLGTYGMPLVGKMLALLFVIVGHMFPLTYEFRGGKGVLAAFGGLTIIDWRLSLALFAVFALIVLLTRYVSLGSIIAAALTPVGLWILFRNWLVTLLGLCSVGLIIYMHRSNIVRLLHGEESKLRIH